MVILAVSGLMLLSMLRITDRLQMVWPNTELMFTNMVQMIQRRTINQLIRVSVYPERMSIGRKFTITTF